MHLTLRPPSLARAGTRLALAAGAVVLALTGAAAPAAAGAVTASAPAGDAFRYWGYFQLADGGWSFAQTGPDGATPADGAVEGWRFATAGAQDSRVPRATPSFDDVCAAEQAGDGEKRVAVVIDYGRAADGAEGAEPPPARAECAVVAEAATGADVLAAVAETRVDAGLVCGLDGYPSSGCGEPVPQPSAEAQAPDEPVELTGLVTGPDAEVTETAAAEPAAPSDGDGDGSGATLWLGLAAAAAVVAFAVAAMRRRRDLVED